MIILTLRTDKPQAEIGLFDDTEQLAHEKWQAHRELSAGIHRKIAALLKAAGHDLEDLGGIVIYRGPGSFTGLRIGFSVANALAYSYGLPITSVAGDDWQQRGIKQLLNGLGEASGLPDYGGPAHTTTPRK